MTVCICSAQSGNLQNPQIMLLNTRSTEHCQSADWHTLIAQTVEPQAITNPSLILHYPVMFLFIDDPEQ